MKPRIGRGNWRNWTYYDAETEANGDWWFKFVAWLVMVGIFAFLFVRMYYSN